MQKKPFHREDIKAAIRKRHGSLAAFEREKGLPAESVRDVLRGKTASKTAVAIADEIGVSVQQLFPGRFQSLIRDDVSETNAPAHRLSAGAK
jgi:lambda repressor-like predicted transcriptional regulator